MNKDSTDCINQPNNRNKVVANHLDKITNHLLKGKVEQQRDTQQLSNKCHRNRDKDSR